MSDKRTINISIAGVSMELTIPVAEEEVVRRAAKIINENVLKYSSKIEEPEPYYFLAYVAMLNTVKMLQQEQKFDEVEKIYSKIDKLLQ